MFSWNMSYRSPVLLVPRPLITCPSDLLSYWFLNCHAWQHQFCDMLVRALSFASNRFQSLLRHQKSHEATGPPKFGFSWVFTCRAAVWLLSNLIGGLFFWIIFVFQLGFVAFVAVWAFVFSAPYNLFLPFVVFGVNVSNRPWACWYFGCGCGWGGGRGGGMGWDVNVHCRCNDILSRSLMVSHLLASKLCCGNITLHAADLIPNCTKHWLFTSKCLLSVSRPIFSIPYFST